MEFEVDLFMERFEHPKNNRKSVGDKIMRWLFSKKHKERGKGKYFYRSTDRLSKEFTIMRIWEPFMEEEQDEYYRDLEYDKWFDESLYIEYYCGLD